MVEPSAGYFIVRVPTAAAAAAAGADRPARAEALPRPAEQTAQSEDAAFRPYGADGFDLYDLLDVVNPLQHIPIVSTLYRAVTGDEIASLPRVVGGTLFGGPIGGGVALVNAMLDESTGRDAGEHVLAFLAGGDATAETAVAEAADTPPPATGGTLAAETLAVLLGEADLAEAAPDRRPDRALTETSALPTTGDRSADWFNAALTTGLDRYRAAGLTGP